MEQGGRAHLRLVGGEIRGRHASVLLPSLAEDTAPELLQTALIPKGDSGTTVMKCVCKSGDTLVCDWLTSTLRDGTGAVQGYLSMVQDITAREQAERELRKSRTFLQTVIDTEPECVKLIGEDGSLLLMNPAGLDMLQAESLEQVRGQALGRSLQRETACPSMRCFMRCSREGPEGSSSR